MIGSFIFNNVDSESLGLICRSISRPILPPINARTVDIPGVSGLYDFGAQTHQTRTITMQIAWATATTYVDYRKQIRILANWLSTTTWSDLIINDEPDKLYKARIVGEVKLDSLQTIGQAQIQFECQPYAYALWSTGTEYTWVDAEYPWMSEYAVAAGKTYQVALIAAGNLIFNHPGTREINYKSPQGSKFLITVNGTFTTLSLSLGGKTLTYNTPLTSGILIFDNVEMEVYIVDMMAMTTTNELDHVTGDYATFLTCLPGDNTLRVTGTALNVTVTVDIIPLWI